MLRKLMFWSTAIFFSLFSAVAIADLTILDGAGATKTLKNFVCETTKLCSATVIIKSDGTETGTTSAPFQVGSPASAFADGWDATKGAKADSACGTDTGTCSQLALIKRLLQSITTLNSSVAASIPAGTNPIGDVNLRQGGTVLSTTNGAYFNQLQGNAVLSATNPSFARPTDGTNARVFDPCQVVAKSYKAFSQTATAVLVTGTSAKKTYICSIAIIAGAAEIFNLTAGTGSTCGTNTVAVMGSTTAANGLSLAANGGLTLGNGGAALAATTVTADDLCLQQSGSNRLSGSITYVQL